MAVQCKPSSDQCLHICVCSISYCENSLRYHHKLGEVRHSRFWFWHYHSICIVWKTCLAAVTHRYLFILDGLCLTFIGVLVSNCSFAMFALTAINELSVPWIYQKLCNMSPKMYLSGIHRDTVWMRNTISVNNFFCVTNFSFQLTILPFFRTGQVR